MMIRPVCSICHDEIPGDDIGGAIEDALNTGWDLRAGKWLCGHCILEEEKL